MPDKRKIDVSFPDLDRLVDAYDNHISKGGYFAPCDDPSPRTTPVEILFHLPGLEKPLAVTGEVAFAATPETPMPGMGAGMAVQFASLDQGVLKAFKAAITIAKAEGMPGATKTADDQNLGEEWEGDEETEEGTDAETDEEENEEENEEEGEDQGEAGEEIDEMTSQQLMHRLNQMTSENLYPIIRQMPIHQKIVAAKRGNRAVRAILLQGANKKVLTYLLQNPQIGTPEVIQMLKLPNLNMDIVQMIAKNSQYNQNEEIRYLITTHPKTPLPLALNMLNSLNTNSLAKIAKGGFKIQVKSNALKLLELRRKKS